MKWFKWYIILMVLIIGTYIYAEYSRPPRIDWTQTLVNADKIPYGTYVVYNRLRDIIGVSPVELNVPVYDHVNNRTDTGELYILIANRINTTPTDEEELLKYISAGNTVFISAEYLSKTLEDTLNLNIQPYYFGDRQKDSTLIHLVNPLLRDSVEYGALKGSMDGFFPEFDTASCTILGMNNQGQVNFLRMKFGKGTLYLHSVPAVFTNYFALKGTNFRYVERALSYLPAFPASVFWDEYYKSGRGESMTPLRVILSKPNLKYAYFTALAAVIIYLLFQSKRRQRIIPVLSRPGNATLDFVETVGRVYYNQNNHANIASKKITYLLDYIRTRFGLSTNDLNEDFISLLAQKTGVQKEKIQELVVMVNNLSGKKMINREELLRLNELTEEFYKSTKS